MNRPREKPVEKPVRRRPFALRVVLWLVCLGVLGGLLGAVGVVGLFLYYGSDPKLPRIGALHDYRPKTVTRILDRRGVLIGELSAERRTVVPYTRIPRVLVQAVVSAEDAGFFQHRGLDYVGMLRALVNNLRAGRYAQGGSTITQQVVKTFLLGPERTIRRKVQDVILARRLESELSKDQILNLYLQQIYFGHGRYGVQEASRFFFGRDVERLGLGEAAMLAGLPQSPERLSPLRYPERAKRRQLYVLREMARRGHISPEQARKVGAQPIEVVRHQRPFFNVAPELVDLVRDHLSKTFGADKLTTLGLQVQTTVDARLQQSAREALQWGLRALDAREGYGGKVAHVAPAQVAKVLKRLARTQPKLEAPGQLQGLVTRIDDVEQEVEVNLGRASATVRVDDERYNPQKDAPSRRFAVGDLIRVRWEGDQYVFDGGPQGALVAIDPRTGEVRAMVGGYDFAPGGFNRALQALRQPGSSFKPFLYAAALDSGRYTAASVIEDGPVSFGNWEPKNFDGVYRGPVRLREAVAHSINTVAARVMKDVGPPAVQRLAGALGIATPLASDLSLALGSSEVRVLDLALAYAAFANGGQAVEPHYVTRVGSQEVPLSPPRRVIRPEVAYLVTSLLQSVVSEGTGQRAQQLRHPVAGKTGTTNEQKDVWFVGYTPELLTAVWVGFDTPRSLGKRETGGRAAIPIWVRFMQKALAGLPRQSFPRPSGLVVQRVDPRSGLLAPTGALEGMDELFIAGTEPKETAPQVDPTTSDTVLLGTAPVVP
ncbi:MAG: PBP1A family penicillin-binding protein [Deltaproteobacteria bacterium]|nr:PBP1A family penicillin-binding protein [Deltaproteobacteria bacterium]